MWANKARKWLPASTESPRTAWGRAARAPPGCRRKSRDRKEAGSCPVDQIPEAKQAGDTHTALWKPPGMQLNVQESLWSGGRGVG